MKYKTKPFEIEAILFTGDNWNEISKFAGSHEASYNPIYNIPNFAHVEDYWPSGQYDPAIIALVWDYLHQTWVGVHAGDYIIRGMKGELYPCDPVVFNTKYERLTNDDKE